MAYKGRSRKKGHYESKKKKTEFSKIIICVVILINVVVLGFSMYMMWITMDLSPLCYIVPSVAAETSAATAGYYSKAKVENRIKLMKQYGIDLSEHAFSENF